MAWRWMMLVAALMVLPFSGVRADDVASAAPQAPGCAAQPLPAGQPWTLHYSWGGGLGPGSVALLLKSDGQAVLTTTPTGGKPTQKQVTVPAATLASIAATLAKSPLECVRTLPRNGYIVFDLGRYALQYDHGGKSASAYIDECHTVDDGDTFDAIVGAIQQLAPLVGESLTWGPAATTSAPGKGCENRDEPAGG